MPPWLVSGAGRPSGAESLALVGVPFLGSTASSARLDTTSTPRESPQTAGAYVVAHWECSGGRQLRTSSCTSGPPAHHRHADARCVLGTPRASGLHPAPVFGLRRPGQGCGRTGRMRARRPLSRHPSGQQRRGDPSPTGTERVGGAPARPRRPVGAGRGAISWSIYTVAPLRRATRPELSRHRCIALTSRWSRRADRPDRLGPRGHALRVSSRVDAAGRADRVGTFSYGGALVAYAERRWRKARAHHCGHLVLYVGIFASCSSGLSPSGTPGWHSTATRAARACR